MAHYRTIKTTGTTLSNNTGHIYGPRGLLQGPMALLGLVVQAGSWKPFSFRFKWAHRFFEALSQVGLTYAPIGLTSLSTYIWFSVPRGSLDCDMNTSAM